MSKYTYVAKNKAGKSYKGSLDAQNEEALRKNLKNMGFYVMSVKLDREVFSFGPKKVKPADLVVFSRQFSSMIDAGLSLLVCLKALEKQTENIALREVISNVSGDIETGTSLSEAMAKHPEVFSDFFIALVKAGETAGLLNEILGRLADYLEKQDNLRRTVRGAFAYPAIVGTLALLVVSFLVIVVVPIFSSVYARMNLTLPGPTLVLIWISNFVRNFWWLILIVAGGAAFFYSRIKDNPVFRTKADELKISLPVFGTLVRKAVVTRFIRTFGDMVSSGVPLLESLKIAEKVAANRAVSKVADMMERSVRGGGRISDPLSEQDIFPAMAVQMMVSGEESGKLDFMLKKAADSLDRDVDDTVKRLVIKIEPLMTFFLAVLVGFIAVAIYLPIFDVIRQMG
ncbi:MAG: type II secretion system F family protein [Candidatus Omnitrophota bacterium]